MGEWVIELEGVEVRYGYRVVLSGISMRVAPGEAVLVLGHNGAGKSTLLKMLSTLIPPRRGDVSVLGHALPGEGGVRRRLGYLGHDPQLYLSLTAVENLRFAARLHGLRLQDKELFTRLEEVGLLPVAMQPVSSYSRGMLQRLALIRVSLHGPDLLLLDEPFTGLDTSGRKHVLSLLERLSKEGKTVVLTTHEIREVYPFADRVLGLLRGRVSFWDSTENHNLERTEAWLANPVLGGIA